MTTDELGAPLQRRGLFETMRAMRPTALGAAAGAFSACVIALVVWLHIFGDPLGGEPNVVVRLDGTRVISGDEAGQDAGKIDIRESVEGDDPIEPVRDDRPEIDAGGEPDAAVREPAPAPAVTIKGLTERGPFGPLPRIGRNGLSPAQAYARRVKLPAGVKANAPRIAILIGGMGLSASGTADAINRLPADVTLAFAPYAKNLKTWVSRARQSGHEVMLQVPMEPFDYPDNDPGPYTLVTSLRPAENIRRLQWLMSRMGGYTGVVNYMGARFTSKPEALQPIIAEFRKRGLLYVDDGTSKRSQATQIAAQIGLRAGTADIVLDAVQTGPAIAAALERLEKIAREKGSAIAVGSGLPITFSQITDWTEALLDKGIVLVPVSALVAKNAN